MDRVRRGREGTGRVYSWFCGRVSAVWSRQRYSGLPRYWRGPPEHPHSVPSPPQPPRSGALRTQRLRRPRGAVGSGARPALPSGSRPCPGIRLGEGPWGNAPRDRPSGKRGRCAPFPGRLLPSGGGRGAARVTPRSARTSPPPAGPAAPSAAPSGLSRPLSGASRTLNNP